MAIAVFGQLDHLLRERNLSLADLKRQIEERYGLEVEALDGLIGPQAVRQADLTLAAAAAIVLGVDLGELFAVEELPRGAAESAGQSFLTEDQTHRLWALLDLQDERDLTEDERRELCALVDEEGRRFGAYHLARYAARRGISTEEAQRESDEGIAEAAALNAWLDADPRNIEKYVEDAKRRLASSR